MRTMTLALAVLLAGPVRADDEAPLYKDGEVFLIDEVFPLPENGRIPLTLKAGPVDITEVRIEKMPSKSEVANARRNSEKSRVEPIVMVKGMSDPDDVLDGLEIRAVIEVALEDDVGTPVISCIKVVEIDPGEIDDVSPCTLGARTLYTQDWPKVKFVSLKAKVNLER